VESLQSAQDRVHWWDFVGKELNHQVHLKPGNFGAISEHEISYFDTQLSQVLEVNYS
jgi:hypothetical protein